MQSTFLRGVMAIGLASSLFAFACDDSSSSSASGTPASAAEPTGPDGTDGTDDSSNGAKDAAATTPKRDGGVDSGPGTTKPFDPGDVAECLAWLRADRDVSGQDA